MSLFVEVAFANSVVLTFLESRKIKGERRKSAK